MAHILLEMKLEDRFEISRESPSGLITRNKTAKIAGGIVEYPNGYKCWKVRFQYKIRQVHRIIWELANGPIPEGMSIDHINGNGLDNRLENLRLATHRQNMANSKTRSHNATGVKGVRCYRGKYAARLAGKHVGTFLTMEEAKAAYDAASLKLYGAFHRSS